MTRRSCSPDRAGTEVEGERSPERALRDCEGRSGKGLRPGSDHGESAADSSSFQPGGAQRVSLPEAAPRVRLASVVMFVRDLDVSVDFYRELLGMEVRVRSATAALLVSADSLQVYLRAMGTNAPTRWAPSAFST
ncbi:VOC family protein [Nonomuraea sp. NPDC049129]|uniref:VOC family protein n=1 Tax=Nonomuraea sp. NPDC049129 TaxID=3155272 RepID=UPI0033E2B442